MTPQIRITVLLFLGVAVVISRSGDDVTKHPTHEQAVEDTKTFLSLLESTHPDPYTNLGGKIEFKRKAEKLTDSLPPDGLSVPELTDRRFDATWRDSLATVGRRLAESAKPPEMATPCAR
jgi:hypothetical protein